MIGTGLMKMKRSIMFLNHIEHAYNFGATLASAFWWVQQHELPFLLLQSKSLVFGCLLYQSCIDPGTPPIIAKRRTGDG